MGVCRQVCSVVSAGSDACYVRTPYDDKSAKEIAGLLVRVQSEELYQRKHFDRDLVDLRCPGKLPDNDAKRCSAMRLIYSCCASQAVEAESGASRSPVPPSLPMGPLDHLGSTCRARPSAAPRSSSRRAASGSAVRCRPAGRSGVSAYTVTVGPSLAAGGPSAANEFDRLLGVGLELPRRRSYPVSAGAGRCRLSSTVRAARACSWCSVPARAHPFVSEWLARSRSEGDHDWVRACRRHRDGSSPCSVP